MLTATGCCFRVYEDSGLPDNGRQEEFVYTSMGTLLCLCPCVDLWVIRKNLVRKKIFWSFVIWYLEWSSDSLQQFWHTNFTGFFFHEEHSDPVLLFFCASGAICTAPMLLWYFQKQHWMVLIVFDADHRLFGLLKWKTCQIVMGSFCLNFYLFTHPFLFVSGQHRGHPTL